MAMASTACDMLPVGNHPILLGVCILVHVACRLHVFFGCYHNLFRLMAKCGVLENLLLKEHTHTFVNTGTYADIGMLITLIPCLQHVITCHMRQTVARLFTVYFVCRAPFLSHTLID